jgi:hypothetical protein
MWKRKPGARVWGIIAAFLIMFIFPVGTFLAIYAFWFLFSLDGRRLYLEYASKVV